MKKRIFYIVDVFAEKRYSGNQLAVFINSGDLSDEIMQMIAKEINYSETTFILSQTAKSEDEGYDVRIFTPDKEVPFAGHPTLGTAYIIAKEIIKKDVEAVVLNLRIGRIPVNFQKQVENEAVVWMKQMRPAFGEILEKERVASVLNLNEEDFLEGFSIQEVSTGLPFIMVPLKSLEGVRKVRLNKDKYFELIRETNAKAILVFSGETYKPENDLNVRVFADYYGVTEDPATGSANGCLAGYLFKYNYSEIGKREIRVEQGYEIGRPSRLYLKVLEEEDKEIAVHVGGKVKLIARGELL